MQSRQSDSDVYWQPGQNLPGHSSTSHVTSECTDSDLESTSLVDVLQTLQFSIDGQFTKINSTLGQISSRLDALEGRQHSIEETIKDSKSSSCSESGGGKRKHRVPIALQVWYSIYVFNCMSIMKTVFFLLRVRFTCCITRLIQLTSLDQKNRKSKLILLPSYIHLFITYPQNSKSSQH